MEIERVNPAELVQQFTDNLESAANLPLLNEYKFVVGTVLTQFNKNWWNDFHQSTTAFESVCFLLRAIESEVGENRRGVDKLGLSIRTEEILRLHGKSDGISRRYLSYGKLAIREEDKNTSLMAITYSVFYAASSEQLSRALVLRCRFLHHLRLFDEAIEDGLKALSLSCPKSEIGKVHLNLGHCYLRKYMLSESMSHYTQALTAFVESNIERNFKYVSNIIDGLNECFNAIFENKSGPYEPRWKCFRSKAPSIKESKRKRSSRKSKCNKNSRSNTVVSKLLSSPNCAVRLKYTGCISSGWTMEVTHGVSTGDILMVEKPWAMSLWRERTKYCYFCSKRCHNLKPCHGCPHVGFCSEECEVNAKNPAELPIGGNKHIYDCQGFYSLIVLDNDATHTAFNSLAKVPMNTLMDYIYSTGPYAGGRGHQAFKGADEVRSVPPAVFDPSDYSSIAFLTTSSAHLCERETWLNTQTAVFLTYCLYSAGYPMEWFDETDAFYTDPSSTTRAKVIPASWIAACMLYHLQAVRINGFSITETIRPCLNSKLSKTEEFATAIYPTISLINHSCNPNVAVRFSDKGVAFLYALQPLHAGSEISLAYQPLFYVKPTDHRREFLLSNYRFFCECDACVNDWNESTLAAREKLVCRNCHEIFLEQSNGCPMCRSLESMNLFKHLRKIVIPKLMQYRHEEACKFAELKYAALHIDKALEVLQHPSCTIIELQILFDHIFALIYDNQTIEQWANMEPSYPPT
nr:SET and MYND domain containing protein 4 [Hymenolepis microstoma]